MKSEHASQWRMPADVEYESLLENQVWDLIELPKNEKAIGSKWAFKVKRSSDRTIEHIKWKHAQTQGIDYDETFAPVVRYSSISTPLKHSVSEDLLVHQIDLETAFLNKKLEETVYMYQREEYVLPGNAHLVCKVKKSLYGLKQSPRRWNHAFQSFVESLGSKQSKADPCIHIHPDD